MLLVWLGVSVFCAELLTLGTDRYVPKEDLWTDQLDGWGGHKIADFR